MFGYLQEVVKERGRRERDLGRKGEGERLREGEREGSSSKSECMQLPMLLV